ncbi:MAG: hypothetical protein ACLFQV_04870 [Vulcanimicrobiota bacterium]
MQKNIIKFLSLIFLFTAISTGQGHTSPYGPSDKMTVYDRLYESDLVIYGKIMEKIKSEQKGNLTEIQVFSNVKGGKWKKGDYFYINSLIKEPVKSIGVIYLFRSSKGGVDFYELNAFYHDKKKQMYEYTLKTQEFMENDDEEGRLRWLFTQVDSRNEFIAWDSFAQLGMASYKDLKKAAPAIDRESLRYLISTPEVKENRKSFYCFLLGLAGNKEDLNLIKRVLSARENLDSPIVYGAMMAYGLLSSNYEVFYYKAISKTGSENMQKAVLEAVKNMMLYNRPSNPQPLLNSLYWALKNGNSNILLKAVEVCQATRITGPVRCMRNIYYNSFSNNRTGKIAVINYLKFVRKKTPDAVRLLDDFKKHENDPSVRERI